MSGKGMPGGAAARGPQPSGGPQATRGPQPAPVPVAQRAPGDRDGEEEPEGPDRSDPQGPAEPEQPQDARAARRELVDHMPGFMFRRASSFGGALVGGCQQGIAGGTFHGAVSYGTVIHQYGSDAVDRQAAGAIPEGELAALERTFLDGEIFASALHRLREERVLVLAGAHSTGRRAAATMLLRRLGTASVRAVEPGISPAALAGRITDGAGHLVCDLATSRATPFAYEQLLALRDRLAGGDSYLVITTGPAATLVGFEPVSWEPPATAEVLRARLRELVGARTAAETMELEAVRNFLSEGHAIGEVPLFADLLARHRTHGDSSSALAEFGRAAVDKQIRSWLSDSDLLLRDKGFLLSLAVFDQAPYPLAAELADSLFTRLQHLEDPYVSPRIPVFGTGPAERLRLARAVPYEGDEATEWGPVPQTMARFENPLTAPAVLTEVWLRQPSARSPLTEWVRELAKDPRPLVRTRAAAATATLAHTDLPSSLGLLIAPWAGSRSYAARLVAANSLALAQLLGVTAVRRILTAWCDDPDEGLRWTGSRGWALLAGLRTELAPDALAALMRRARNDDCDPEEREQLASSVTLLLTTGDKPAMVAELAGLLRGHSHVRALALNAFLSACEFHAAADRETNLLAWYAEGGPGAPKAAPHLTALWHCALDDRRHTADALRVLRGWVYEAQLRPSAEAALTSLLPALTATDAGHHRIGYLLRTMPGADGGPPPAVAGRVWKRVMDRPAAQGVPR